MCKSAYLNKQKRVKLHVFFHSGYGYGGDMEDFQPLPRSLESVSGQRSPDLVSQPLMTALKCQNSKGYVPKNMQKNNAWGLIVFLDWRAERNQKLK